MNKFKGSFIIWKILKKNFFKSRAMDDDLIDGSYGKLLSYINGKKDSDLQESFNKYLRDIRYTPINDFNKGLEWFNVTEPLSFEKHLKGKIVVLDFFTYCCINCMHILPDLKEVEQNYSIENGLVVVGVHSAKFENEKISSNILSAVQRYNIMHAVVNDDKSNMWNNCGVNCWPTLLLLGPYANPIVMLTGEGHKERLKQYIHCALNYYKNEDLISDHELPINSSFHLLPDLKGPLLFPGKITNIFNETGEEILAVSDSGNNRILIFNKEGTILRQIGSGKIGLKDGSLEDAKFNNPQGLAFKSMDVFFVADTDNHAIRKVDFKNKKVETVAGTGFQGHDYKGGKLWKQQSISSPWDLCLYSTSNWSPNSEGSVSEPLKDVLIIAMAGTHQIWALFLDDTVWWKGVKYSAGTCIAIAGSGREENRNNQYPHAAAFAQPSGLALSVQNREIFIADSESSSIRKLSLVDGKVSAVVGGDRDPNNLFAFGDKDGRMFEAKLQHTLGLAISKNEDVLFVADTYNHKLKKIDITKNTITTLSTPGFDTTDGSSNQFKEPAGLCVSLQENKLYLADTNNHSIKTVHFDENYKIVKIENLNLNIKGSDTMDVSNVADALIKKTISISDRGGKIIFDVSVDFKNGLKLTEDAPQKWQVKVSNINWSSAPMSGTSLNDINVVVNAPSNNDVRDTDVRFIFNLVTCTDETCLPKQFVVKIPIHFESKALSNLQSSIKVVLSPDSIKLE